MRASHTPPPPARTAPRGFTLMELIVAVGITTAMLLIASRLFYDAQQGVQRGQQTSQVIAEARTLSQPFLDDARSMNTFESPLGTNAPGFLVIVQEQFAGVRYPNTDNAVIASENWSDQFATINAGEGPTFRADDPTMILNGSNQILTRSDQLGFFRSGNGLESLTPGSNSRFDSEAQTNHARVWYGHVWPAENDAGGVANRNNDDPGDGDYDLANGLTLGRQALLLVENNGSTRYPNGRPGNTAQPANANNRVLSVGAAALDTELADAENDVLDLGQLTRPLGFPAPPATGPTTTFSVYDDGGDDTTPGLFRIRDHIGGSDDNSYFGSQLRNSAVGLQTHRTNGRYRRAAVEWMFLRERLRGAQSVNEDFSAGVFTSNQIAQLHPVLSTNVADFAIEFAADWVDDSPRVGAADIAEPGLGFWPDGEPDRDGDGNIIWYTGLNANPDNDGDGLPDDLSRLSHPITRLPPAAGGVPVVPVREMAIDGNDRGPATGTTPNPFFIPPTIANPDEARFIWAHSGDRTGAGAVPGTEEGSGAYWPYLIRIRYRVLDGRGELRTIDPITGQAVVGRWFEQIIPVPRPRGLF